VPSLRQYFLNFIFQISKTKPLRRITPWIVAHMSDILPINRLAETQTLIAFFHPKPAYPFHVLIVPKSDLDSVMAIDSAHTPFLSDCFTTIQKLVKQYNLESSGYRIIVNGGKNQDFPILHFHLVSDEKRKAQDS